MKNILAILCLLWATISVQAQPIKLPATYGNGMVLQRNTPLTIKGHTHPYLEVNIVLNHTRMTTQADAQGFFYVTFPAQKAGGPYHLTFDTGKNRRTLTNVYIGEVWLCSGQSNMELRVHEVASAKTDLEMADTLTRLHFYNMESAWPLYATRWNRTMADSVDQGLFIKTGLWTACSARSARNFSAIGFHFARILADSLNCHVGVLSNAVGGSTTEGWIDSLTLQREFPEMLQGDWRHNDSIMAWARHRADYNLHNLKGQRHNHPYAPAYLFHSAISPLSGYNLRGVLWYQGESNAELITTHERLFPMLVNSWRQTWHNPHLPFYFVQLSSIATRPTWPAFRNSQRLLAEHVPHCYLTISSDVGDSLDVHPRQKRIVAERLAAAALHHEYGFHHILPSGPQPFQAQTNAPNSVCIRFNLADGLRFNHPSTQHSFEVAGTDGIFHPAEKVSIKGSEIHIYCSSVPQPRQIRYAWQPFTRAQLVNKASIPCSTFVLKVQSSSMQK